MATENKKHVLGFIKGNALHLIKSIPGNQGPEGPKFKFEDFTPEELEQLRGPQGGISARYDANTETLILDSIS
jgi:hypothetical protein